jgi:hypothetical protein
MASHYPEDPRPARPVRNALIIAALAFLGGLALMAWALTRWEPARRLVRDAEPVPTIATPQPAMPSPALPNAPPVLTDTPPLAAAQLDGRIAGLEDRMARIDMRAAAAAGNAARAEGLLIAFAARRAIDRGVALGFIEGELRERFATTQPRAVAAIIASAQAPVTLESLHQKLEALRPKLAGPGANEGWWDATRRTLGSLIVVRKQGTDSPAPDDRLDRAMLRIESGQVEGALAEVARMPGRASATAWMTDARRYIEAHRALDILEAAALTGADPQQSTVQGQTQ